MTYGEKISQLRKAKNMTQQQLGDALNVSAQAVSKWEHDLAEPDLSTIKKLATIFEVSIEELLDMDTPATTTPTSPAPEERIDPEKLTSDVVAEVEKTIKKSAPATPIGHCVNCGCMVYESNLGSKTPKVLCKKCKDEATARELREEGIRQQKLSADRMQFRKRRNRSIFWGTVAAIIVLCITIGFMVKGGGNSGELAATFFIGLGLCYVAYSLVSMFFLPSGVIWDIMAFFIGAPLKLPGIIFTWDLDGFIFLIVMKIVLGVLGFLLGCLLFFLGLAICAVVAPFVYPFAMAKTVRKANGSSTITDSDRIDLI